MGPYPSGAPAIFIDQVGRLGQSCGMIGSVGDDDFGRLNIDRLDRDGVDVSAIEIHPDAPTGTAFVAYSADGARHFVFNIAHSASGELLLGDKAKALLNRAGHLHLMGSSLFAPKLVDAARRALELVKARGGSVSFDPNIRGELARGSDIAEFFEFALDHCDIFLPSGTELLIATGAASPEQAIASLLARGVKAIVVKNGVDGATYHDGAGPTHAAAFGVEEVDPTGAGDCFGATFIVCRLRGMSVAQSLRYANAAGAKMVTVKGPMEGASSFAELDAFLAGARPR
jgi:sugar/nucleoside kinase (ribokinase family)